MELRKRTESVKDLEETLERLYKGVTSDPSFFDYIGEHYGKFYGHYANEKECREKVIETDLEDIVHRYTSKWKSGYDYVQPQQIDFEHRVWLFAENNPEQWMEMTQRIAEESDVTKYLGFQFMDTFIHNGLYDDWMLAIAKKDKEIIFLNFFNEVEKNSLQEKGYEVKHLNEESLSSTLDELEHIKITKKHKI